MIRVPNPEFKLEPQDDIEVLLLERRRTGCMIGGIDFDQDAELLKMRAVAASDEDEATQPSPDWLDPREWHFLTILGVFCAVVIIAFLVGQVDGLLEMYGH